MFEQHDVGFVDAVPVVEFLMLENVHYVGVVGGLFARGVGLATQGDGEGVGALVDGFGVWVAHLGPVFGDALGVFCGGDGSQILADFSAIAACFGKDSGGCNVVVEVDVAFLDPEGEVVLLDRSGGWRSRKVCWKAEGLKRVWRFRPVDQHSKVLHPDAEAIVL